MIWIDGIKAFSASLLSGDERVVDSVITAGCASLLVLFAFQAFATFVAREPFNAITFCTGAGGLIGAIGASKGVRHRLCGDCGQPTGNSDVDPHATDPRR